MEQKCLKTSVYVNDVIFSGSCEQAIDVDFTLPDFCPDIERVLKCNISIKKRKPEFFQVFSLFLIYK